MVFKEKEDNYTKAKIGLKKIKRKFDGFIIDFPDITHDEIMFIKDQWERLPKKIGKGVKIMALKFKDGCKSTLTSYDTNGYIRPHKHLLEYEIGQVIEGSVENLLTGKVYGVGDTYQFNPNEVHYFHSNDKSLVYSVLTTKTDHKCKKLTENTINMLKSA